MKQKKVHRAIQYLKEALQLDPEDTDILILLGNILQSHGKPQQAAAYYQEAMVIKPDELRAILCTATALYENG